MWISFLVLSILKFLQIVFAGCAIYSQIFEWFSVWQLIRWENLMALNKIIYRSTETVEETILLFNKQEITYRWVIGIIFVLNYIYYLYSYAAETKKQIDTNIEYSDLFSMHRFAESFSNVVMYNITTGSIKFIVFTTVFGYIYFKMVKSMEKCHNFTYQNYKYGLHIYGFAYFLLKVINYITQWQTNVFRDTYETCLAKVVGDDPV